MLGIYIALAGLFLIGFGALEIWRRRLRVVGDFPEAWDRYLRGTFAVYRCLPDPHRAELQRRILEFVHRKNFEACGGLPRVREKMQVLIAAQACLLLVGRPGDRLFPGLHSILLYPGAFRDTRPRVFSIDEDDDDPTEVRLGESWSTGSVVLAWDSVRDGAARRSDGMNVVLHEFAHQLDHADGSTDGAPILDSRDEYVDWAAVMRREFEGLKRAAKSGREPLLDPYGAEDPAEFFAVATETFFERPEELAEEHEELYGELRDYYRVDPARWRGDLSPRHDNA